jgi:hypothetical protein
MRHRARAPQPPETSIALSRPEFIQLSTRWLSTKSRSATWRTRRHFSTVTSIDSSIYSSLGQTTHQFVPAVGTRHEGLFRIFSPHFPQTPSTSFSIDSGSFWRARTAAGNRNFASLSSALLRASGDRRRRRAPISVAISENRFGGMVTVRSSSPSWTMVV